MGRSPCAKRCGHRPLGLLVASLLACHSSPTGTNRPTYLVETDRHEYASGDTIQVRATNLSNTTLEVGICGYSLQRLAQDGWVAVHDVPSRDEPCDAVAMLLPPNGSVGRAVPVRAVDGTGVFRVVVRGLTVPPGAAGGDSAFASDTVRVVP